MIWNKYTIKTKTEAADIVASILFDNGIIGVEIDDNKNLSDDDLKKMYVDIPLDKIDDGIAKVSFYVSLCDNKSSIVENYFKTFDKKLDNFIVDNSYKMSTDNIFTHDEFKTILCNIKKELNLYNSFMDMGELIFTDSELDDKIFLNKWKENFKSFNIGDISIIPCWEKTKNDGINIYIEPGSAFGTGKHATTKLCIEGLKRIINNRNVNNVLDIGCGSGILSIVAKKLGAKNIFAIDIDNSIEQNLIENLKLNGIFDDSFKYYFGNILTDDKISDCIKSIKYDIIVANILAPVIISLIKTAKISNYLNENGYLIFSGIIKEKENSVIDAIKNDDKIKDFRVYSEDEWRMIECKV